MKILFISDIHSNFPALEAVWKQENDSDYILCAGDLVDWGFYPKEVLDWCRQHNAICVAGNHDRDLCAVYRQMQSGVRPPAGTFQEHNIERLTEEDFVWLENLKDTQRIQIEGLTFYMRHSFAEIEENRKILLERWIKDESLMAFHEHWPKDLTGETRILIFGHSHQSWIYQVEHETFFLNPGSLSYRVNSDSRAKGAYYAVWENGFLQLRHVDYDRSVFLPLLEDPRLREDVRTAEGYHLVRELPIRKA